MPRELHDENGYRRGEGDLPVRVPLIDCSRSRLTFIGEVAEMTLQLAFTHGMARRTPVDEHFPPRDRVIAENQAFVDGNKRTALAAAYVFLGLNGYRLPETDGHDPRDEHRQREPECWEHVRIMPPRARAANSGARR